jgi:hypothetical protein
MAVEVAPEHGNRKALAAILDQAHLDLEQRDIRRATDQAKQIVALRLDTAGPAIAPEGEICPVVLRSLLHGGVPKNVARAPAAGK